MYSDDEWCASDAEKGGGRVQAAAPKGDVITDPEVWADYWSEELVTLYHGLQEHARAMGTAVLDACTFPDFVEFCFKFSSGRKPVV